MRRPSILWRGILWVERFLPTPAPPPREPSAAAKRWGVILPLVAALIPSLSVTITQLFGHHAELAAAWPSWRPMFVDVALIAAGAALVAAVAFGVVAMQRGRWPYA